jgi:hypothetical protein
MKLSTIATRGGRIAAIGVAGALLAIAPTARADETWEAPAGAELPAVKSMGFPRHWRPLVALAEIDIRITNALGRVVAEQSLGSLHAGRHRWVWDGRDAAGRKAPAGVYYAEVQAEGRAIVTRLMILR